MAVKSSQKTKSIVQIPLDYYRILSVPVTATENQLQQAYEDRIQQKPRREYSDRAIVARQQLIEFAYKLLSDSQCRAEYNSQFFGNFQAENRVLETTSETATAIANPTLPELALANPSIEIAVEQMPGVLLILQELGEYELVLKLGINYLNVEYTELQQQQDKRIRLAEREDIILSLALAYLELGREQWHRREYENAALSGQMGLKMLAKENLFPKVKQELEVDLYRLKPYRILELVAQNPVNSPQRNKGLQLLADMLRQRQGIESQDQSSPSFERFLCFIQQIRTHLTSAEQEQLFVIEAKHSSAISDYLAVYALLARGFALKQPILVLRAQNILETLSQKQEVHWELAISSLLLGLSDRAITLVQKSQEKSKVSKIQQYGKDSQDLLAGLCVYGEDWLRREVLVQFCDLANSPMTLSEYFADRQVQDFLTKLAPVDAAGETQIKSQPKSTSTPSQQKGFFSRWRKKPKVKVKSTPIAPTRQTSAVKPLSNNTAKVLSSSKVDGNSTSQGFSNNGHHRPVSKIPQHSATAKPTFSAAVPTSTVSRPNVAQRVAPRGKNRRNNRRNSLNSTVLKLLFLLGFVVGVGTLGFTAMKLFLNRSSQTAKTEPQLVISLNTALFKLPPVQAKATAPQPKPAFENEARQVVRRWLNSKSAAFGDRHQVEKLNEVLLGSLLTAWRDRALTYQQTNIYREYDHEITIESAAIDKDNPQQATVEAKIKEVARHYSQGNLDNSQSYDDDLLVRYSLVRQGDKWMIAGSEVLEIF